MSKFDNPIALAMLNYVQTVEKTFGNLHQMSDSDAKVAP